MDIFEDIPHQNKKKQDNIEELFEDNSSQSSYQNEDAELFEANLDFEYDPETMNTNIEEDPDAMIDEIPKTKPTNKKNEKAAKGADAKTVGSVQPEFDEKLEEIKTRADKAKNKGKDAEKIAKKKENLKAFVIFQTLIMRNPQHYDNFMKIYILCNFARWHFYTKVCYSSHVMGLSLSKLDSKDFALLDKIKAAYAEDPTHNFKDRLVSLMTILLRNFPYEKFNDHHLMFNFVENGTYSYENLIQIFFSLLQYVGIPARIVSALDLACLSVNKKHFYAAPGMRLPGSKGPVRKRKIDQVQTTDQNAPIVEEFKPKTKQGKLNKKSFGSMITSFTTSFVDTGDIPKAEDDSFDIFRDDSTSDYSNQSTKFSLLTNQDREFESKLSNFKFGPARKSFGTSTVSNSDTMSQVEDSEASITIDLSQPSQYTGQAPQQRKANKSNISKFAFGRKNTGSIVPEIDLSEFKFWLEVFDLDQNKWIHAEPLKRKVYDDQEDIKKRLHGTASLFILAFQKYRYKDEAAKTSQEKYKNYYVRDVTINYIERWHRLLVSRRELNLNIWWNQIINYFKFNPELSNDEWKIINDYEDETVVELEKKDIPQHPREFRYSRHYILPSMLKKYQTFQPGTQPLPMKFNEEPIYEKSAVCELHSRARWRREMRQVKDGEEPAKKIISLVGNGEQLVDLYGHWQTEPYENKLRDDGSLPKNEYGNYELFNGELPEGVVYINFPGLPRLCKKLGIDYVEAVTGFEVGKAGRPHAVISGIIAFQKDEEVIKDAYEKYRDYIVEKEREKMKKNVVGLWKGKDSYQEIYLRDIPERSSVIDFTSSF